MVILTVLPVNILLVRETDTRYKNDHDLSSLPPGCTPCECNQHGQMSLGYCNSTTGKCYCRDNTQGDHCADCQDGYYGDPRHGNQCYLRCEGRTIMGNITSGALGSHAGMGVKNLAHAYCLWILTVHPDLSNLRLLNPVPTITFTMETDIKTLCSRVGTHILSGSSPINIPYLWKLQNYLESIFLSFTNLLPSCVWIKKRLEVIYLLVTRGYLLHRRLLLSLPSH